MSKEKENSRYELFKKPGCYKPFMCGEHVMEDTEEYPYELPPDMKMKHWKCLCPVHYKVYNDEVEKFFFNFDINDDQVSPQLSLMSSPSGKTKAVSDS